jgi:hypothetical protein
MAHVRLFLILAALLLPTLTACSPIERQAALIALRNYGYHRPSTTLYCSTTYAKRSSYTSCF